MSLTPTAHYSLFYMLDFCNLNITSHLDLQTVRRLSLVDKEIHKLMHKSYAILLKEHCPLPKSLNLKKIRTLETPVISFPNASGKLTVLSSEHEFSHPQPLHPISTKICQTKVIQDYLIKDSSKKDIPRLISEAFSSSLSIQKAALKELCTAVKPDYFETVLETLQILQDPQFKHQLLMHIQDTSLDLLPLQQQTLITALVDNENFLPFDTVLEPLKIDEPVSHHVDNIKFFAQHSQKGEAYHITPSTENIVKAEQVLLELVRAYEQNPKQTLTYDSSIFKLEHLNQFSDFTKKKVFNLSLKRNLIENAVDIAFSFEGEVSRSEAFADCIRFYLKHGMFEYTEPYFSQVTDPFNKKCLNLDLSVTLLHLNKELEKKATEAKTSEQPDFNKFIAILMWVQFILDKIDYQSKASLALEEALKIGKEIDWKEAKDHSLNDWISFVDQAVKFTLIYPIELEVKYNILLMCLEIYTNHNRFKEADELTEKLTYLE